MAEVAATRSLDLILDDILHTLVRQARAKGHTWAEIGDLLHVTRQAAFQRFGGATVERPGGETAIKPIADAKRMAMKVLDHWVNERWEDVRADFDDRMTQACSAGMLESAHLKIEQGFGQFLELGSPAITARGAYTVVDVPMAFETGDLNGRVVFNVDEQVAGFFVLTRESGIGDSDAPDPNPCLDRPP